MVVGGAVIVNYVYVGDKKETVNKKSVLVRVV